MDAYTPTDIFLRNHYQYSCSQIPSHVNNKIHRLLCPSATQHRYNLIVHRHPPVIAKVTMTIRQLQMRFQTKDSSTINVNLFTLPTSTSNTIKKTIHRRRLEWLSRILFHTLSCHRRPLTTTICSPPSLTPTQHRLRDAKAAALEGGEIVGS